MSFVHTELCQYVSWEETSDEFSIDKGWIAGAFFLGLVVGAILAIVLIPICLRDWEKKKRQDEEESMLVELERENTMTAVTVDKYAQDERVEAKKGGVGVKGKIVGIFSRKNKKTDQQAPPLEKKTEKGWVTSEGTGQTQEGTGTVSTGMMTVLTKTNSGEADAELTKQDLLEIKNLDKKQKQAKDDMMLKMLKIKLRKMKGKGQLSDPYLADFTQKIIDTRKGSEGMLALDRQEGEEELKKKHGRNTAALENDLENLQIKLDAKQRQLSKDELENIRNELLRTSGLSESEVDELMDKYKQDLAALERKQGIEQARQARHLAERLEKRRHILEFRKLQEQQAATMVTADVTAYEEPLDKLVKESKISEKQKKEILDEHARNLQALQRTRDTDKMRLQSELAKKLQERREARMRKLADKQHKETKMYLDKADKITNSAEFSNNYNELIQQQQQEVEHTQTELDQSEIQEMEKLTQTIDTQTDESMAELGEKMIQTVRQKGELSDGDAKRIVKLHNLQMASLETSRRQERERMKAKLQEKWQQRMQKLQEQEQQDNTERETILEQQDATVKRVLSSNLELSEQAKEKILREHEANMIALNNQLSRSKLKQQMSLENKLSQRRARLADLGMQKSALEAQTHDGGHQKEMDKLQSALDQEILLFEKEQKLLQDNLRKQLALESETALAQQEQELAALIGRLEVGHARRQAVLQKQDKTLQQLQEQLEGRLESGRLSGTAADQIIQQHYNQVESVNQTIQLNRERQEQVINDRIQAKRAMKQRELEDQQRAEQQEVAMARRQVGAGMASNILNQALMQQRQKKAIEELEKDMQMELEKNREQLNEELQKSLEKELQNHKGQFLNQLAAASNMSRQEMQQIAESAVQDTGEDRQTARRLSKSLVQNVEKAKTTLGMMEDDDSDDVGYGRRSAVQRPKSGIEKDKPSFMKKKKKSSVPPPKPAFQTSTGENIHGAWDLDDEGF